MQKIRVCGLCQVRPMPTQTLGSTVFRGISTASRERPQPLGLPPWETSFAPRPLHCRQQDQVAGQPAGVAGAALHCPGQHPLPRGGTLVPSSELERPAGLGPARPPPTRRGPGPAAAGRHCAPSRRRGSPAPAPTAQLGVFVRRGKLALSL